MLSCRAVFDINLPSRIINLESNSHLTYALQRGVVIPVENSLGEISTLEQDKHPQLSGTIMLLKGD